jgi:integrase
MPSVHQKACKRVAKIVQAHIPQAPPFDGRYPSRYAGWQGACRFLGIERQKRSSKMEYVFPNPSTGRPYRSIHHRWARIRAAAGLSDVRLHDLRHTFASVLVNSGRSLYDVQLLLGHKSPQTTTRYAHLQHQTLREASEEAEGLL